MIRPNNQSLSVYNVRKIVITISLVIVGGLLLTYTYYQSKRFIEGPQITIQSPETGLSTNDPLMTITGEARHISILHLNDNQIFVDENNQFNEKLLLSPGYNIITIEAEDKFGRNQKKRLELVLLEKEELLPVPAAITNDNTNNDEQTKDPE